jgi:hypothetical protein
VQSLKAAVGEAKDQSTTAALNGQAVPSLWAGHSFFRLIGGIIFAAVAMSLLRSLDIILVDGNETAEGVF